MRKTILLLPAMMVFFHTFTGFAVTPFFQGLGDLEGGLYRSYATDVSGDGSTVVGISYASTGIQAFRWTASEGIVSINGLVAQQAQSPTLPKISRDGSTIVGQSGNEAALWTATEGLQPLGILGGYFIFSSTATGVSTDGSIVVGHSTNTYVENEAFRWTDTDGMQGLGFSPSYPDFSSRAFAVSGDGSVVVGSSMHYYPDYFLEADVAVRWTAEDGMVPLLDTQGNYIAHTATDVSADGSVVVGNGRGPTPWQGFRWTSENNIEPLGFLNGETANCYAWGVSGNGEIIVGDSGDKTFIWDEVNGMRSIQELLTEQYGLDLTGWTLHRAYSTSYDGTTIVGAGFNPDGDIEAWVASFLEPAILSPSVNIKPQSCPNPINVKSKGVFDVAILGTEEFDVLDIDVTTLTLEGVAPIQSRYKDETAPVIDGQECECYSKKKDGNIDLSLKFDTQEIVAALGEVSDGDMWMLTLTGALQDGTEIEGTDCITILNRNNMNKPKKK